MTSDKIISFLNELPLEEKCNISEVDLIKYNKLISKKLDFMISDVKKEITHYLKENPKAFKSLVDYGTLGFGVTEILHIIDKKFI